jgi:hypothetical protein
VSRPGTDRLIADLAADLRPVRRVPPLWVPLAAAFALGALGLTGDAILGGGLRGDLAARLAAAGPYAAIALGLILAALGGLLASVAGSTPGRGTAARAGLGVLAAGLLCAFGWAVVLAPSLSAPGAPEVACLRNSLILGALPAAAAALYGLRAAPRDRLWSLAAAALGGGAIGALATHLVCPAASASHWLWGHATTPLVAAAGVTLAGRAIRALGGRSH